MHANIPIFIPHAGCPHKCSFCNQNTISSTISPTAPADAQRLISSALEDMPERFDEVEIAFFGGSFTAIPEDYMTELLEAAYPFLSDRRVSGIRISTRPDAIDSHILSILKKFGVTAIELGAQSMYNDVLEINHRGHTAEDVNNASRMIKEAGFSLGLQMMTGLYGSDDEKDIVTAQRIAALEPDTVRIYPTVVIEGTMLDVLMKEGRYIPQKLDEAVRLCARLLGIFESSGIKVIRTGLHASELLEGSVTGGVYHPALGELSRSRLLFDKISDKLTRFPKGRVKIWTQPRLVSQVIGQRRCNIEEWSRTGYDVTVISEKPDSYQEGITVISSEHPEFGCKVDILNMKNKTLCEPI